MYRELSITTNDTKIWWRTASKSINCIICVSTVNNVKSSKRSTSNQTIKKREEIKKKCRGIEGTVVCRKIKDACCKLQLLSTCIQWCYLAYYCLLYYHFIYYSNFWLLLVSGSSHSFVVLIFHLMYTLCIIILLLNSKNKKLIIHCR